MTMQQPTETQLQQVVNMLARRWGLILAVGIFGGALAGALGLLIPPRYTAKAQIVIDSQQITTISGYAARGEQVNELAIETQVTILASLNHLRRVHDSFLPGPELQAAALHPQTETGAAVGSAAAEEYKRPRATEVEVLSLDELEKGLTVYQERQSRVIAVAFTSKTPELAAVVANQIVRLHVLSHADRKSAEKSSAWVLQELADLNHQLSVAKSDLAERQARLINLRSLRHRGDATDELIAALDSTDSTELSRTLIALRQSRVELAKTYSETHPKVLSVTAKLQELRQKIDREVDRLVNQLESETQIASARVRSLQQRLSTVQAARREAPERELPRSIASQPEAATSNKLYETLLRQLRLRAPQPGAAGSAQLYAKLLRRQQKEMRERPEISPGIRILTVADAPSHPSSPNPILFVFPAFVVFAIGGGLLATVLEALDQGLRSERDVKEALGIPCIGLIPEVRRRRELRMHQYLLQNPFAAYTEAIRSLVIAALELAAVNGSPKVFLVTSSVPGEGKTTLAVSFAVYAARLQHRVLLVDFAFRDPSVLRELEGEAETGVLDVLQGYPLEKAIQHIPELALDYLPLPEHPVDPLALFGSNTMPELLRQLRESYDCVVIDSAAILGTTEARLLVSVVDKVLFAVKWGRTRPQVAQNALNLLCSPYVLERDPADFVSAVVTQVDLKKHARYRAGDVAEILAAHERTAARRN